MTNEQNPYQFPLGSSLGLPPDYSHRAILKARAFDQEVQRRLDCYRASGDLESAKALYAWVSENVPSPDDQVDQRIADGATRNAARELLSNRLGVPFPGEQAPSKVGGSGNGSD